MGDGDRPNGEDGEDETHPVISTSDVSSASTRIESSCPIGMSVGRSGSEPASTDEDSGKTGPLVLRPTITTRQPAPSWFIRGFGMAWRLHSIPAGSGTQKLTKKQPEDEDEADDHPRMQRRQRLPPPAPANGYGKFAPKSTKTPHEEQHEHITENATVMESTFVISVLLVLIAYCLAIAYRFIYPVHYPLSSPDGLYTPWNVSNVSLTIVSPIPDSMVAAPVRLEWAIRNFPAQAIREHGPEPFRYRVFLNDRKILSEFDFWERTDVEDESAVAINKTILHTIRPRDLPEYDEYDLRVEVHFPIPGSDGEIMQLEEAVSFRTARPTSSQVRLDIRSPVDRASLPVERSVLVEYIAENVAELEAVLDDKWNIAKRYISDGNLLLRGLGAGWHMVRLQAYDANRDLIASSLVRFELVEEHVGDRER